MKKEEKCFFCEGKGRIKYLKDGDYHICTVCNGTGKDIKAIYQKKNKPKNKCKYCGRPCNGYACISCLNTFESEKGVAE